MIDSLRFNSLAIREQTFLLNTRPKCDAHDEAALKVVLMETVGQFS